MNYNKLRAAMPQCLGVFILFIILASFFGVSEAQMGMGNGPQMQQPSAMQTSESQALQNMQQQAANQRPTIKAVEAAIAPEKIRAHVRFLADDLREGRYPGLRGGDLAAQYIATQFALYGLAPAGDDGTYLQHIDFVGM